MLLYRLFIWLYPKAVWLLSFSNSKAKAWLKGRRKLFQKLAAAFHKNTAAVIWMHCSSLGEFEQGLPVLESLKQHYPSHRILVTFFSPSGYEVRKKHPAADHVFYLPMDSPSHAHRFLNIVQPVLAIFVKYEFWYYYLQETRQRNIPLLLASGIFREDQVFFRWYGGVHRRMLSFFSVLFVQNQESLQLLQTIGITGNAMLAGDTRFDRVMEIASEFEPVLPVEAFCGDFQTIVAGSTWTDDDEELDHFSNTHPDTRFLVAPHDISAERLDECLKLYRHSMLYSSYLLTYRTDPRPAGINTLIIDNMGMLSRLYRYATVCYVGGGFGDDGIHNILEPAVYGKPVLFGPVYDKYFEADELIEAGGAFSVENALELEAYLTELLTDTTRCKKAGRAAADYTRQKAGATGKILRWIQENRLLMI
ncbi:MAG: 3-deoxy-D-manno-octulosonic acid transferase [Chitinophagaceae bacterium]|nr:3-deoxy-D-manno-octulosonic acid transferase [Chitinophagaceae bacterium]